MIPQPMLPPRSRRLSIPQAARARATTPSHRCQRRKRESNLRRHTSQASVPIAVAIISSPQPKRSQMLLVVFTVHEVIVDQNSTIAVMMTSNIAK